MVRGDRGFTLLELIVAMSVFGVFLSFVGHFQLSMSSGSLFAQIFVSVTGIAGPGGAVPGKPVGTVWFGFQVDGRLSSETRVFPGERAQVRAQTVEHALERLLALIDAS